MKTRVAALLIMAACGGGDSAGVIGQFGPVCGSPKIIGVPERRVTSPTSRQCGISNPVRVHEVAGVKLSQKPLVNCKTARALATWVDQGVKPSVARMGERLESLRVVAHYTCRPRNNRRGAKISEHGKGNAVDVSAFRLRRGDEISVLRDWGKGEKGRALTAMHRAACGPFGVVLGPGSDGFHNDHFHVDTSSLSRPHCR